MTGAFSGPWGIIRLLDDGRERHLRAARQPGLKRGERFGVGSAMLGGCGFGCRLEPWRGGFQPIARLLLDGDIHASL